MYIKVEGLAQSLIGILSLQSTSFPSLSQSSASSPSMGIATAPISIAPLSQGASIQVEPSDVRTYYQASDTSILEITPHTPPSSGYGGPSVIVPAGIAKPNTPLAAVVLGAFEEIHLFYISKTLNLLEKTFKLDKGWSDGTINAAAYSVQRDTSFLYAIKNGTGAANAVVRVGFVNTEGSFSEAWKVGGNGAWGWGTY